MDAGFVGIAARVGYPPKTKRDMCSNRYKGSIIYEKWQGNEKKTDAQRCLAHRKLIHTYINGTMRIIIAFIIITKKTFSFPNKMQITKLCIPLHPPHHHRPRSLTHALMV